MNPRVSTFLLLTALLLAQLAALVAAAPAQPVKVFILATHAPAAVMLELDAAALPVGEE